MISIKVSDATHTIFEARVASYIDVPGALQLAYAACSNDGKTLPEGVVLEIHEESAH